MHSLGNVKDICKKGFDICSFLFLAKRKILEAVHAYEQHHKVSHCQVQLPAGDDKPIPACASLSRKASNMLSNSCWFPKTLEAHSLWKSLQKHLAITPSFCWLEDTEGWRALCHCLAADVPHPKPQHPSLGWRGNTRGCYQHWTLALNQTDFGLVFFWFGIFCLGFWG